MNTTLRFKLLLVPLFLTFATSLQAAKVNAVAPSFLAQFATLQQTSEPTWYEIISDTGDYSVLLPGEPHELPPAILSLPSGKFFTLDQGEPGSPNARSYIFSYVTNPSFPNQMPANHAEDLFNQLRDVLFVVEEGQRLLNDQPLSIDEHPGREIEIEKADQSGRVGRVVRVRLYLVSQRIYYLQVVGSPEMVHSPEAEQFLNSLKRLSSAPNQ